MTRINCVPVESLSDLHLLAEYRELPRVFSGVRAAQQRNMTAEYYLKKYPKYVLGTGHVCFFYPRCKYLAKRFIYLVRELKRRGFNVQYDNVDAKVYGIDHEWFGDWKPTSEAIKINQARIRARLALFEANKAAKAAKNNGNSAAVLQADSTALQHQEDGVSS